VIYFTNFDVSDRELGSLRPRAVTWVADGAAAPESGTRALRFGTLVLYGLLSDY
jgi:hypothetical protein